MTTNATTELERLKKDHAAAIAAENEKFKQQKDDLLIQVKTELEGALRAVQTIYAAFPDDSRASLWKDSNLAKSLRELGLQPKAKNPDNGDPANGKPRSDLSNDDVLAVIKGLDNPTIGQVNKAFDKDTVPTPAKIASKVTVGLRIDALVKAGTITKVKGDSGNKRVLKVV